MHIEGKEESKNMKKRVFALVSALVLTFGMTVSVFASETQSPAASTTTTVPAATSADATFTDELLTAYLNSTSVSTTATDVSVGKVSTSVAASAAARAKAVAGSGAVIATIVDINVPAGTGAASFTLGCANIQAGMKVIILHQLSDGTWETINPSSVENGKVSFTLTSYSPVAVVIQNSASGTAPKTGDVVMAVAFLAAVCLIGTVVFSKKAVN